METDNESNYKEIHIKRNLKSVEVKSKTKNKKTKEKDKDKEKDDTVFIGEEKLRNIQNFQK